MAWIDASIAFVGQASEACIVLLKRIESTGLQSQDELLAMASAEQKVRSARACLAWWTCGRIGWVLRIFNTDL